MTRIKSFRTLVCVVIAMAPLAACGDAPDEADAASGIDDVERVQPTAETVAHVTSRTFVPKDLTDLADNSTLVVVGQACGAVRTDVIDGASFPIDDICVSKVLKSPPGSAIGSSIPLRQSSSYLDAKGVSRPLVSGTQPFLLFLKEFTFEVGKPTGEWVLVGVSAGAWVSSESTPVADGRRRAATGFVDRFESLDAERSAKIPASVRTTDVATR